MTDEIKPDAQGDVLAPGGVWAGLSEQLGIWPHSRPSCCQTVRATDTDPCPRDEHGDDGHVDGRGDRYRTEPLTFGGPDGEVADR